MKKMLTAVTVLGLIAAVVAVGQEVTSVNAVGFNKVTIPPGKWVFVTPTFESFGDSTLADLVGDQAPVGSVAYIWDRGGKKYDSANMLRFVGWSGEGASNTIFRGDAFWLKLSGTGTNTVSFMGEVPYVYNDSATTTVVNVSGTEALGYAYPVDVVWTNTTLSQSMGTSDKLYFWNEESQSYDEFTKLRFTGWGDMDLVIPAGRAFFVKTAATIDWQEIAPYDL